MAKRDNKKNPFMVRISENQGGLFCLVYLDEKAEKIEHLLIHPASYAKEGFLPYIQSEIKKKKLNAYSYNRPYEKIFKPVQLLESTHTQVVENENLSKSMSMSMPHAGNRVIL